MADERSNEYSDGIRRNNNGKPKKSIKKTAAVIAVALVLAVSSVLIFVDPAAISALLKKGDDPTLPMYSPEKQSYSFYKPNYELDVTSVPEYMDLDRYLYYSVGNDSVAITDGNYAKYGEAVEFFGEYFNTVISGDTDKYNTLFTDRYYETNEMHGLFAPQMIYGITVELLSRNAKENGEVTYAFNVSYKIYRNDGTFRNDIPSDASKTLYFELVSSNGRVKIDRITYRVAVVK